MSTSSVLAATDAGIDIMPCGPAAVRVVGATGDAERDWRTVHHLARRLTELAPTGLLGCIPTYDTVLVEFDAMAVDASVMVGIVEETASQIDADAELSTQPRHFDVPVVYGGEYGPDLADVARITGLDAEEVIRLHSTPLYVVRCLGAPGGSPMLDGPAFPVPIPRLPNPRAHVPVGKVSVAGRQATITPTAAPGGWCLVGATPLVLFDIDQPSPVPYRPGDTVSFHRIGVGEYRSLEGTRLTAAEVGE
ncbi:MAG TPA: carboxyltransferase domain-containing protein [Microbacterium sp.]|uniref:5-oxoprolinase subunit B family protein n=1 Tax=Microbacterium sp. TaxID=51671 RepID=UPI002B46AFB6|nr:carboxyltransferase domain-containing protein [Microbacterium sp.]HKT56255.1 carboxyltransferase domain-containing protein [Microbacterium sp.]